ncbi:MAG: FMN-dependent NADH-azoreductase [Microbacteriaceae bacterium]|nr:FMN-dependent NADH-azoreductase [Microbacteriaceae bacterium]
MPSLLRLDSSADPIHSHTRALTAAFADAWEAAGPQNVVVARDLHRDPLPHLADAGLHWPERLRPADADVPPAAQALQDALIAELLTADVVLVGAPMYNYSMPSSLKAWIDHIHVPGVTSSFDGDTRPMAGRPAVIVTSRGASYDAGSATAGWDHGVPALELILGASLGMTVTVISTSLTLAQTTTLFADQLDRANSEFAEAQERAAQLGRELGAG